jgi:hypothetical protein
VPQTISVTELKRDIEEMPNDELMEKYGFARKDLEVLLDTFVGARHSKAGRRSSDQP